MRHVMLIALVLAVLQALHHGLYETWRRYVIHTWIQRTKLRRHVKNDAAQARKVLMREMSSLYRPSEGFRASGRYDMKDLQNDMYDSSRTFDAGTLDDLITRLALNQRGADKGQISESMYDQLKRHHLERARTAAHEAYAQAFAEFEDDDEYDEDDAAGAAQAGYSMGIEAAIATLVPEAFAADANEDADEVRINADSVKVEIPTKTRPLIGSFEVDEEQSNKYAMTLAANLMQHVNTEFAVEGLADKLEEIRKMVEAIPADKSACIYAYAPVMEILDLLRKDDVDDVFRDRLANLLGHYFKHIVTMNNEIYGVSDLCEMVDTTGTYEDPEADTITHATIVSLDACLYMNGWRTHAEASSLNDDERRGAIREHLLQEELVKKSVSEVESMNDNQLFEVCNDLLQKKTGYEALDQFHKGQNYELMDSLMVMLSKVRETSNLITNAKNNGKTHFALRNTRNKLVREHRKKTHDVMKKNLRGAENGVFFRYKVPSPVETSLSTKKG